MGIESYRTRSAPAVVCQECLGVNVHDVEILPRCLRAATIAEGP